MKILIIAAVAVAVRAQYVIPKPSRPLPTPTPQSTYGGPSRSNFGRADFGRSDFGRQDLDFGASQNRFASSDPASNVPIIKDERVMEEDGRYNFEIETGDGTEMKQSGSPDGPEGAVVKTGEYSYNAPDGSRIQLSFVADENGFQPQGDHLPVAPEFPHEIPQFVLDQIAKAAEEDATAAREGTGRFREEESAPVPSQIYG